MDVCDETERLHADGEELVSLTTTWFASRGVEAPECVVDVAHEVARYGDGQLHAVGAILGGIASQEIIKIITQQYTPMTKRLIYDGVHSTTAYVG
jgi:amyloid beta precursor protein binding protein 1